MINERWRDRSEEVHATGIENDQNVPLAFIYVRAVRQVSTDRLETAEVNGAATTHSWFDHDHPPRHANKTVSLIVVRRPSDCRRPSRHREMDGNAGSGYLFPPLQQQP